MYVFLTPKLLILMLWDVFWILVEKFDICCRLSQEKEMKSYPGFPCEDGLTSEGLPGNA